MPIPGRDAPPNMLDYDAERAAARFVVPPRFNYVLDVVEAQAASRPDDLALLSLGARGEVLDRHSFARLAEESRRMANALLAAGIEKGERIFVMLPRIPEWYVAMLGAMRIGAVPMPATTQLSARDVQYRMEKGRATVAVTDSTGAEKVDAAGGDGLRARFVVGEAPGPGWLDLRAEVAAAPASPTPADPTASDDPLLLYFTSGTVSYPKMVLHTQASLGIGHTITARYWQDLKPGDVHWTISDTGWAKAAWGKLFGQWTIGATVVQMDMGKPDPDLLLDVIVRHRISTFCAPPTLYRSLVQADLRAKDWAGLRHCVAAGEPLNPEVIRVWREATGLEVHDGYGQTETVNLVANYRCLPIRPGSMGKPTPGNDVAVVDDDGQVLPPGVEGHVAVRTDPRPVGLFVGYEGDPDATAAVMRDGWYFTGDRAVVDEDGYFWFSARDDDVITSSAYRIGPFEVESALIEHPAVVEAAVVGEDDPLRTQIVVAFCTLAPGYEPSDALAAELQEHVKALTAPYKYPRKIVFGEELPKTVSGKIRRSELRERLRAR